MATSPRIPLAVRSRVRRPRSLEADSRWQPILAAKSAVHVAPNRPGRSISRWMSQIYCSGFRRKRFPVLLLAFSGFSSASARLLRLLVGIRPDEYIRTSCFSFYTLLLSPSSLLFPFSPNGQQAMPGRQWLAPAATRGCGRPRAPAPPLALTRAS